MKNYRFLFFIILTVIISTNCGRKKGDLLTERIQYDVVIKSEEQGLEWWIQNLESHKREQLVTSIINAAKSGEHKVYDVINYEELTSEKIAERSRKKELMTLQREYAPYEEYDTLVVSNIELSDITKIRFLEEWYLNQETGFVTKKVLAICPMLESYTETGELRGHMPLYWISFEKNFPLAKD